jgi:hypothetical protein
VTAVIARAGLQQARTHFERTWFTRAHTSASTATALTEYRFERTNPGD